MEEPTQETVSAEELLPAEPAPGQETPPGDPALRAVLEAIVYVTEEPLTKPQIAAALGAPLEVIEKLLGEITAEYDKPEHGIAIREIAGGYKMATKPEHHDAVRREGLVVIVVVEDRPVRGNQVQAHQPRKEAADGEEDGGAQGDAGPQAQVRVSGTRA